jgi:hypothetical protein
MIYKEILKPVQKVKDNQSYPNKYKYFDIYSNKYVDRCASNVVK